MYFFTRDFYKFLQLRHYLQKHNYLKHLHEPPTNMEQFFISVMKRKIISKYVSHAYKMLQQESTENTLNIKEKWELEMNIIIKDEEWVETMRNGHKITKSQILREFEWKTKTRFFRTPFITSRFGKTWEECWRGCGLVGDHTHIFWDCPKLTNYWKDIHYEIKKCLSIDVPLTPNSMILGIFPNTIKPKCVILQLKILLLIAKKMVTVFWLKPQPPTISQWKNKLKEVYNMEQITARLQMKMDIFMDRWSHIEKYISS